MEEEVKKAFFIKVIGPHDHIEEQKNNFWEEESLLQFLGYKTVKKIFQYRNIIDSSTYIGKGKIEEVIDLAAKEKPALIFLNSVLNPAIIYRVEQKFWQINPKIKVWDRVDLILNIFEKHAFSSEAKLQIELAKLKHLGPRIYGLGKQMSQQYGVAGVRAGFGETVLEKMKRYIKDRINLIEKKLKKIEEKREFQIKNRKEKRIPTISLVGYTNAGKTTLFNVLTGKQKQADNRPFTTLDTVVGKVKNLNFPLIASDTIGFIKDLPPFLIEAFKATLLQTIYADIIFHVVDISDKNYHEKISSVLKILSELGINNDQIIFLFNKTDKLAMKTNLDKIKSQYNGKIFFISAKNKQGINNLLTFLNEYFSNNYSFSN